MNTASPASAPTPPLGQQSKFMPSLDGSTFVPYGNWSSSRLSIAEMTELIELIYAWGGQHGVRFATDKGVVTIEGFLLMRALHWASFLAALAVVLAILVLPAFAQQSVFNILPPVQYDYQYEGDLTIKIVARWRSYTICADCLIGPCLRARRTTRRAA